MLDVLKAPILTLSRDAKMTFLVQFVPELWATLGQKTLNFGLILHINIWFVCFSLCPKTILVVLKNQTLILNKVLKIAQGRLLKVSIFLFF